MKITIGGSFHRWNWENIRELIKKFEDAGHTVLAPGLEWEPINLDDDFVKFRGEEERDRAELQNGFLRAMKNSDAYVVCDPNGYIGFTVATELGSFYVYKGESNKNIYLTERPIGSYFFDENGKFIKDIADLIKNDPAYEHIKDFYFNQWSNHEGKNKPKNYDRLNEFIDEQTRLYIYIFDANVGIDSLLEKEDSKKKIKKLG